MIRLSIEREDSSSLADNAATRPAGQLFTSANEYARFCIAFLNQGVIEGKQVLSPDLIQKLSTPYVQVPGSTAHYGYGLNVNERDGIRWLSHSGNRSGYGSQVRMCPEKKFAVIVLCNKTGESPPRVSLAAARLVLGAAPPAPRESRDVKPLADSELQKYAGTYGNGRSIIRLAVKDGKLTAPIGGDIEWVGENRFRRSGAEPGAEPELVFVAGKDGKIEYLVRGRRALKRAK